MGIPTFAVLVNDKVVTRSDDPDHFSVEQHFFRTCMAGVLSVIDVDEAWYLAAHPDVGKALEDGVVPDCKTHFIRFGYYEHRMPRPIEVDEDWYRRVYPDIDNAVKRSAFASGQDHFNRFGYREGRMPYANFALG
jgi:hypothetical protein